MPTKAQLLGENERLRFECAACVDENKRLYACLAERDAEIARLTPKSRGVKRRVDLELLRGLLLARREYLARQDHQPRNLNEATIADLIASWKAAGSFERKAAESTMAPAAYERSVRKRLKALLKEAPPIRTIRKRKPK
jgi:hypothetical protein